MNKFDGMLEDFKEAKQIFLTTLHSDKQTRTRAMTNFNESPYKQMWFPSFKETRKVEDIKLNPKVVVSFPAKEEGKWYRIKGNARLAPWEEVKKCGAGGYLSGFLRKIRDP